MRSGEEGSAASDRASPPKGPTGTQAACAAGETRRTRMATACENFPAMESMYHSKPAARNRNGGGSPVGFLAHATPASVGRFRVPPAVASERSPGMLYCHLRPSDLC